MLQTLRARLVFSHLLPMFIVVPLVGIGLIYFLETRVLLPGLLRAYSGNTALVAEITQDQYRIWLDPIYAQTILARVSTRLPARVMFIAANGQLMASSDPADLPNLTGFIVNSAIPLVQDRQVVHRVFYNRNLQGEAFDIWEPVIDNRSGVVIGIIRITYTFENIAGQFVQLRYLVAVVLLVGLGIGGTFGLALAMSISHPLQRVTDAVNRLARGESSEPLRETGPVELRSLQTAVNYLVDRLRNLEEARRHLLANLVHELGRPLGALRSAVQALLKGAVKQPQLSSELLTGMDGELIRLQGLLSELTQLYDQELGNLELERQPTEMSEWLAEVIAPWQAAAGEKQITFHSAIPASLPVLHVDSLRLAQALGNLLSNAVKFTPAGANITVGAEADESTLRIAVTDEGPGIPEDERDKIFTPFFRGSQGRRFTEGMGLGLSIARDLVQAHGGVLECSPDGRSGSRFVIHLPRG